MEHLPRPGPLNQSSELLQLNSRAGDRKQPTLESSDIVWRVARGGMRGQEHTARGCRRAAGRAVP